MARGTIGAALQDTLLLLNSCTRTRGDITHVIGDFMAVVYSEDGVGAITLVTVKVDDSGNIAAAVQDSDVIASTATTVFPGIVKVADGVVAVCYDDDCSGPLVVTYVIDSAGDFGCAPTDTLDLSVDSAGLIMSIHATQHDGLFVVLHYDGCGDLQASTFTIDGCGNISALIDQQEIDASPATAGQSDMIWTGVGDFYAFTFTRSNDSDGFIETWEIDACGNFAACPADTHEFALQNAERISINSNDDGTLFLFYEGPSSGGDVKTVTVDGCGVMTNGTKLDTHTITNDTTDLLRLDLLGDKNVFLGVSNSQFTSWSLDACDAPSQVDFLSAIGEVTDQGRLATHPNNTCYVFGCGYKASTTEFFMFSLPLAEPAEGKLSSSTKDSLVVEDTTGSPLLHNTCHAVNEWFAVVYTTQDFGASKLSTFSVDVEGNISNSLQDTVTLQTCDVVGPTVTKVVDGVVVVSTRFDPLDCPTGIIIETYTIGTDGDISNCPVDTQTITTAAVRAHVNVAATNHSTVFVVTWAEDSSLDVDIATVTIDSCGNISAVVDSITPIASNVGLPQRVDLVWTGVGDFYAIGYTGTASDGFITTFDIDACGNIGCPVDTLEFNTDFANNVALQSDESGTLVVTYDDLFLCTGTEQIESITVDACGVMTQVDKVQDDVTVFRADKTLLWIADFSLFIRVAGGTITSWTLDGCNNLTKIDTLGPITGLEYSPSISRRPCSICFIAGGTLPTSGGACEEADITLFSVCFDNEPGVVVVVPQFMGAGNAAKLVLMGFI